MASLAFVSTRCALPFNISPESGSDHYIIVLNHPPFFKGYIS